MNTGEWWVSVFPSASNGAGWYVGVKTGTHKQELFGPYASREEAIKESGMPKPKSELEEVWEVSLEMKNALCRLATIIGNEGFQDAYNEAFRAKCRFDCLVTKYEKHLKT